MKLESNFKNMVLSLTVITIIAASALGGVYSLTAKPIAAAKQAKQENAIKEVLPPYDTLADVEVINSQSVFKAYLNNQFVGAAVEATSKNGFSGEIKIMVGFDKDGNIVNYSVLQQAETPGLGTKMVDWFKTEKGKQNINGLNPSKNKLTVNKDGGDIDAITAATISSRAFLEAVNIAYNAYTNNAEEMVTTGATMKHESDLPNDVLDELSVETTQTNNLENQISNEQ